MTEKVWSIYHEKSVHECSTKKTLSRFLPSRSPLVSPPVPPQLSSRGRCLRAIFIKLTMPPHALAPGSMLVCRTVQSMKEPYRLVHCAPQERPRRKIRVPLSQNMLRNSRRAEPPP